jgi:hypothetical protein
LNVLRFSPMFIICRHRMTSTNSIPLFDGSRRSNATHSAPIQRGISFEQSREITIRSQHVASAESDVWRIMVRPKEMYQIKTHLPVVFPKIGRTNPSRISERKQWVRRRSEAIPPGRSPYRNLNRPAPRLCGMWEYSRKYDKSRGERYPYHLAGEGRQSRSRPAHGTARARLELPATLNGRIRRLI